MSQMDLNGFFSLDGKVALVTGGKLHLASTSNRALTLTCDTQAQEVSVYTQQQQSF